MKVLALYGSTLSATDENVWKLENVFSRCSLFISLSLSFSLKEMKEEINRLQEEDILRLKDEDDDDRTMVPHIEPLKGGLEEVRSPESDEGILTPDESEDDDDNHRKRTTTVESEEWVNLLQKCFLNQRIYMYKKNKRNEWFLDDAIIIINNFIPLF